MNLEMKCHVYLDAQGNVDHVSVFDASKDDRVDLLLSFDRHNITISKD